jgi:hypothetical protein
MSLTGKAAAMASHSAALYLLRWALVLSYEYFIRKAMVASMWSRM